MNTRKIAGLVSARNVLTRIVVCLAILAAGLAGMATLAAMKKPPSEVAPQERALKVEALRAIYEDVPVSVSGYGEAKPLNVVTLAPEVSGKVVEVHPRLEAGEVIARGEVLFRIDPRNYQAARDEAESRVRQLELTIERLRRQEELDRDRMRILERSRELTRAEFERLDGLLRDHQVGTRSGVEAAERAYNTAAEQAEQMSQALALYPLRIRETGSQLEAARASLELARTNLDRCTVEAPFRARVKSAEVEAGQYLAPGQAVATLADDRVLEILVPLDSRDARQWLRFDGPAGKDDAAWFNGLARERVRIRWTEAPESHAWFGRLDRIVAFDPRTRTLTVAVRVEAEQASSGAAEAFPLVEGMFCRVEIPGQSLRSVVRVPRWAVSFQNTVYVSEEDRLKTVPVTVARVEGDEAFISGGIEPGDLIVTTRLADPLENRLLEITNLGKGAPAP